LVFDKGTAKAVSQKPKIVAEIKPHKGAKRRLWFFVARSYDKNMRLSGMV
jgi:hypothetical protein